MSAIGPKITNFDGSINQLLNQGFLRSKTIKAKPPTWSTV